MTDPKLPKHMIQNLADDEVLAKIAEGASAHKTDLLLIDKKGDDTRSWLSVDSKKPWQSTGINVSADYEVRINASGNWNAHPNAYPDGHGPEGTGVPCPPGYAMPGASEGALIGKFGPGGAPFMVGSGWVGKTPGGTLFLTINDDLGGAYGDGFGDNKGSLHVRVTF